MEAYSGSWFSQQCVDYCRLNLQSHRFLYAPMVSNNHIISDIITYNSKPPDELAESIEHRLPVQKAESSNSRNG